MIASRSVASESKPALSKAAFFCFPWKFQFDRTNWRSSASTMT